MSKPKRSQTNNIPQWQSERMKIMIAERWQEVLLAVEAREQERS